MLVTLTLRLADAGRKLPPPSPMQKYPARRLFFSLSLLSLASLPAQQADRASLRLLHGAPASSMLARIDPTALPPGASIDSDLEQVFVLHSPNAPDIGVVALYLNVNAPNQQPSQCGVSFIAGSRTATYIPVMGSTEEEPDQLCGAVRAVGLAADPGPKPRLIFIFDHTLLHGDAFALPTIFVWDTEKNTYKLDHAATTALRSQTHFAGSIAAVRQLLASHP